MKLPHQLTTVTTLSKTLAMILFIALPFVGFFVGTRYQESLDWRTQQLDSYQTIKPRPMPRPSQTKGVKTYIDSKYKFQIDYPETWQVTSPNGTYPAIYISHKSTSVTFYPYTNPDAGKFNVNVIKKEVISIGTESAILNYYNSSVTKQLSAYADLSSLKGIGKIFRNINFYLDKESEKEDLEVIKQILSTFKFN